MKYFDDQTKNWERMKEQSPAEEILTALLFALIVTGVLYWRDILSFLVNTP